MQGLVLPQAFLGKSNSIEETPICIRFEVSNLDLVFRFLIGKALHPLFLLAGYPKATDRSLEQKNASLSEACVALYSGSSGIRTHIEHEAKQNRSTYGISFRASGTGGLKDQYAVPHLAYIAARGF